MIYTGARLVSFFNRIDSANLRVEIPIHKETPNSNIDLHMDYTIELNNPSTKKSHDEELREISLHYSRKCVVDELNYS